MTRPTKVSIELRDIHTFVFLWHGLFVIERRQSSFETGDTSSCKKSIYGRWLLVPLDKYNDKAKGTCFTPPLFICNGQKPFFTIVTWIFWNRVTGPKKNLSKGSRCIKGASPSVFIFYWGRWSQAIADDSGIFHIFCDDWKILFLKPSLILCPEKGNHLALHLLAIKVWASPEPGLSSNIIAWSLRW